MIRVGWVFTSESDGGGGPLTEEELIREYKAMAMNGAQHISGYRCVLLPTTTVGAAVTGSVVSAVTGLAGMKYYLMESIFVVSGGGTTMKVWLQTSVDGGVTWFDIMNHAFTTSTLSKVGSCGAYIGLTPATPTDGSLADNTATQGLLGDRVRVKYTSTGTFTGATTLTVYGLAKG